MSIANITLEIYNALLNQKILTMNLAVPSLNTLAEQSLFFKKLESQQLIGKPIFQISVPDAAISFELLIKFLLEHDIKRLDDNIHLASNNCGVLKSIVLERIIQNAIYLGVNVSSGLWDSLAGYFVRGIGNIDKLNHINSPAPLIARIALQLGGGRSGGRVIRIWSQNDKNHAYRAVGELAIAIRNYKDSRYSKISDNPLIRDEFNSRGFIASRFKKLDLPENNLGQSLIREFRSEDLSTIIVA